MKQKPDGWHNMGMMMHGERREIDGKFVERCSRCFVEMDVLSNAEFDAMRRGCGATAYALVEREYQCRDCEKRNVLSLLNDVIERKRGALDKLRQIIEYAVKYQTIVAGVHGLDFCPPEYELKIVDVDYAKALFASAHGVDSYDELYVGLK